MNKKLRTSIRVGIAAMVLAGWASAAMAGQRELILVANDQKVLWDAAGKRILLPPGNDNVLVVDIGTDPLAPKIVANLPLMNYLALIANRADNSISVLKIAGKSVKLIDTVAMGEQVSHVAIAPDGKRAVAAKFPGHKAAFLAINGDKVTYDKQDVPVGLWPYNLDITPDGKLLLTADNGLSGASDGNVDTVTIIDLEAAPPRVIDKVVVGDSPEGFAISPNGKMAVAMILRGSDAEKNAFFYNRNGSVVALKIDGKKVTRTNEVEVRGIPEGAVFSDDSKYLYVGNFLDGDVTILQVTGDQLVDTGKRMTLPGHPATMRARAR